MQNKKKIETNLAENSSTVANGLLSIVFLSNVANLEINQALILLILPWLVLAQDSEAKLDAFDIYIRHGRV